MDDKIKCNITGKMCDQEPCHSIQIWIAEHDARINAYWEQQHKDNDIMFRKLKCIDTRVTTIEKKIMLVCGVFAGLGALLGNALPFIIEHIKGP